MEPLNVTVDQLDDMAIYGAGGDVIGEIEKSLGSRDGQILAVSVEVGGFLGISEKEVIVPLEQLRLDGLRLTLDLSKEEIEALPVWSE